MENFIREYKNHAPRSFCDALIAYAEELRSGVSKNEASIKQDTIDRKDFQFWLTEGSRPDLRHTLHSQWSKLAGTKYLDEFQHLAQQDYYMDATKIQATIPGEGFHRWHYDGAGWYNEFISIYCNFKEYKFSNCSTWNSRGFICNSFRTTCCNPCSSCV